MHPTDRGTDESVENATPVTAADGPVAVVLGGSRGLGLLIAKELLTRGHHVVVAARDVEEVEDAARTLRESGPVSAERCDVRDRHDVGELVGRVEHTVGPIEVLVTVAGVIQTAPVGRSNSSHEFEDAMDTMAWGPIHAAMTVLPHMRRRGRGRIGTVTSIGGMVSPPHLLPYATAKFAAVGFSDGLAAALSGSGVTATTIAPGLMRTGGHQHARFGGDASGRVRLVRVSRLAPAPVGRRRSCRPADRRCRARWPPDGRPHAARLARDPVPWARPGDDDAPHGADGSAVARRAWAGGRPDRPGPRGRDAGSGPPSSTG